VLRAKSGFLLIELLVVMVLIGIMTAVVLPNLQQRVPGHKRQVFVAQMNALLKFATDRALVTNAVHRLLVDFANKKVTLQAETAASKAKTAAKYEPEFEPVKATGLLTTLPWPSGIEVRNFYIQGEDEFAKRKSTEEIWFFIMPNGLTQDVIINIADANDKTDGKARQVGLVLNPFTAQFKLYDTYQKP